MLVILQALLFIESSNLMSRAKLNQIRRAIQTLFTEDADETEVLEHLVSLLQTNLETRRGFSEIGQIRGRISKGIQLVDGKLNYLIQYTRRLDATSEESAEFFLPLVRYTTKFRERLQRFDRDLIAYLAAHEERARAAHEFRIAERASVQLRQRLTSKMQQFEEQALEADRHTRKRTTDNFDHENARHQLDTAEKEVVAMARQMMTILSDMKAMCQMAMNADMRDTVAADRAEDMDLEDVFVLFTDALHHHDRVASIADFIIEHFRLIQRTHSLLKTDYENFETSVQSMSDDATEYFETKEHDLDLSRKHHHARSYEALIQYLEHARSLLETSGGKSIKQWSRLLSSEISRRDQPWSYSCDGLLVAKVAAEADLSNRDLFRK